MMSNAFQNDEAANLPIVATHDTTLERSFQGVRGEKIDQFGAQCVEKSGEKG
jgi:hypothetical protein